MKTEDFNFNLPDDLIAQYPTGDRGTSRLLILDRRNSSIVHSNVSQIADYLEPGTVMIFNDSKVRKARIFGTTQDTGAVVEFLLLSPEDDTDNAIIGTRTWRAMCSKSKKQGCGRRYNFPGNVEAVIKRLDGEIKILEFSSAIGDTYLDSFGHMPLPPYIKREDTRMDESRYQTIYARTTGSAACPTAGLHFTEAILETLQKAGICIGWVTLHVGLGTFLPVRSEEVERHVMHEEWYEVPEATVDLVAKAKREGRKVLAVGTTSLRTLESAWNGEGLRAGASKTGIFIYPGYEFKVIDAVFTNFHTPKSTLLMLVSDRKSVV